MRTLLAILIALLAIPALAGDTTKSIDVINSRGRVLDVAAVWTGGRTYIVLHFYQKDRAGMDRSYRLERIQWLEFVDAFRKAWRTAQTLEVNTQRNEAATYTVGGQKIVFDAMNDGPSGRQVLVRQPASGGLFYRFVVGAAEAKKMDDIVVRVDKHVWQQ